MPLGMLGKYERLDVLGHGASGIVYLAKDTLLGRQVALKEVAAQGEDKERILGEARVLDRLRHPNIVQVMGVDEIDGRVVIAMEYVRGHSLQDILRRTPQLPVAEAVGLAAQICDGLAFAHAHRTVHRDVKPANILVDRGGMVKLVDFGLAEVLGTHSFAGGAGTYAYMAPEDFHEEEQSDRQSDIWAAGVILYEMLAGHRPFSVGKSKDPFSWKRAVEETTPSTISSLRPDTPSQIDAVLSRALAKDKRDRYVDAGDMADDLRALAISLPSATDTGERSRWQSAVEAPHEAELTLLDAGRGNFRSLSPVPGAGSTETDSGPTLLGFPAVGDIDGFLATAPDHWEQAQAALSGGALTRWLLGIGEAPLARVAQEIADEPGRDDGDRLRDFLYRAGLELGPEARRCYADGERLFKEGQFTESVRLLRRASRLDPSQTYYHQRLAQALRATGDAATAALVLEHGLSYHPAQRVLAKAHQDLTGAEVTLSTDRVDFGVLRRGQSRAARLTVRNSGSGVLQGRVAAAPGWVRVEPAAWTTRQRQPLTLTAETEGIWQAPAAYQETVVLETSGGRQEITVLASVLPARRGIGQVLPWYLPLLLCCLLPALAGTFAPWLGHYAPNHFHHHGALQNLWQPGMVASGLLCGALFVVAFAADTVWALRLLPLFCICLFVGGFTSIVNHLYNSGEQLARAAMLQTAAPVLALLVLQAVAVAADPHGWGRWQIWRWIVAAVGLLISYALLHMG